MPATRWVLDHPWRAIAAMLVVTAGLGYGARFVGVDTDVTRDLPQNIEAKRLYDEITKRFPAKEMIIAAVVDPDVFSVDGIARLKRLTKRLDGLRGVQSVLSPTNVRIIRGLVRQTPEGSEEVIEAEEAAKELPTTAEQASALKARLFDQPPLIGTLVSNDAGAISILIFVKTGEREADVAQRVVELADDAERNEGFELLIGGRPAATYWAKVIMGRDMGMLSGMALMIIILILVLTFRSLRGVLLPLVVVIGAVAWTFGLMGYAGLPLTHSTEVMPILLIAIGVADGIHILKGYYARAREAQTPTEAVAETMRDLNRPVVLTSITTAVGFSALGTSGVESITNLGLLTAFGVMAALIFSLVLIPAVLVLLKLPKSAKRAEVGKRARFETLEAAAGRYARFLVKRKGPVLGGILVIIGLAIFGGTQVVPEMSNISNYRADHPLRVATEEINQRFGGVTNLTVVVDSGRPGGVKEPAVLKKIDALEAFLRKQPHVGSVRSIASTIKLLHRADLGNSPDAYRIPDEVIHGVERWTEVVDGKEVLVEEPFTESGRNLIAQLLEAGFGGADPSDFANLMTPDQSTTKIDVFLETDKTSELDELVANVRAYIAKEFGEVKAELTGMVELMRAVNNLVVEGQAWSIATSLGLVWLLASLLFRSLVMGLFATLPLFFSLFLNFGTMGLAGIALNLMTMATSSIAVGVGIDYAIHFVHRTQAERRRGLPFDEAVPAAMRGSGVAILINALTVAAGFSALVASQFRGVAEMGFLIALTMITSSFAALTILPVLFAWLKPKAFTRGHSPPAEQT